MRQASSFFLTGAVPHFHLLQLDHRDALLRLRVYVRYGRVGQLVAQLDLRLADRGRCVCKRNQLLRWRHSFCCSFLPSTPSAPALRGDQRLAGEGDARAAAGVGGRARPTAGHRGGSQRRMTKGFRLEKD
jgi:hypothetical protein